MLNTKIETVVNEFLNGDSDSARILEKKYRPLLIRNAQKITFAIRGTNSSQNDYLFEEAYQQLLEKLLISMKYFKCKPNKYT